MIQQYNLKLATRWTRGNATTSVHGENIDNRVFPLINSDEVIEHKFTQKFLLKQGFNILIT